MSNYRSKLATGSHPQGTDDRTLPDPNHRPNLPLAAQGPSTDDDTPLEDDDPIGFDPLVVLPQAFCRWLTWSVSFERILLSVAAKLNISKLTAVSLLQV